MTALIGPSGCGKSTFLRLINRMNDLIPGTRIPGSILLDGEDIHDPRVDVVDPRRRVGMVFQRSNPFPKSIYENVAYGPRTAASATRPRSTRSWRTRCAARPSGKRSRTVSAAPALSLSGGQQQRLCIARARGRAGVLLMDEPASALDPLATAKIEELIHRLGRALHDVIVTHNMQQAARVSDMTAYSTSGASWSSERRPDLHQPEPSGKPGTIAGRFG